MSDVAGGAGVAGVAGVAGGPDTTGRSGVTGHADGASGPDVTTPFDRAERRIWSGRAEAYARTYARLCAHPVEALLDVGCGSGTVSAAAAERGADVYPSDAEHGMVEETRRAVPGAGVRVARLPELPYQDVYFDAVLANFVLNHVGLRHDQAPQALTTLVINTPSPRGRLPPYAGRARGAARRRRVLRGGVLRGGLAAPLRRRGVVGRVRAGDRCDRPGPQQPGTGGDGSGRRRVRRPRRRTPDGGLHAGTASCRTAGGGDCVGRCPVRSRTAQGAPTGARWKGGRPHP